MAKKVFTDESLSTFVDEIKSYTDEAVSTKADSSHTHTVSEISDLTATATELNYVDGVTSNIQTQLDGKMESSNPVGTGTMSMNRKTDTSKGAKSVAMGNSTTASGTYSVALGNETVASGSSSYAEGYYTTASGNYSHAEGSQTTAIGSYSHAEGFSTNTLPSTITSSTDNDAVIDAWGTTKFTLAKSYSHAEGANTLALGSYSHTEGFNAITSGDYSHAEGYYTTASGNYAHAEGSNVEASGNFTHAEGSNTEASGNYSHAEGRYAIANGEGSHAEGYYTTASGIYSHAEGYDTSALSDYQHVQGKYNIDDAEGKYSHIVGNGTDTNSVITRSNAHTLDWNGNAWFAGDVYVGGTSQDDASASKLISENNNSIWVKKDSITQTFTTDDAAGWYQLASFRNFNNGILLLEAQGWWEESLYLFYGVNYSSSLSPSITIIGNTYNTKISQFRINYIADNDTYYLEAYITPTIDSATGSHNLFISNIFTNHVTTSWGDSSSIALASKTVSVGDGTIYATLNHNEFSGVKTTGNIVGDTLVVKNYGTALPSTGVEGQIFFKQVT